MQHFKTLVLAAAMSLSAGAARADLVVTPKQGAPTSISLDKLRKITFSQGRVHFVGATTTSYAIADVRKLSFGTLSALRSAQLPAAAMSFRDGTLTFPADAPRRLELFAADGRRIAALPLASGQTQISLTHLPQGCYMVRVGQNTLKFLR